MNFCLFRKSRLCMSFQSVLKAISMLWVRQLLCKIPWIFRLNHWENGVFHINYVFNEFTFASLAPCLWVHIVRWRKRNFFAISTNRTVACCATNKTTMITVKTKVIHAKHLTHVYLTAFDAPDLDMCVVLVTPECQNSVILCCILYLSLLTTLLAHSFQLFR